MNPADIDKLRAAVALPGWEWVPGMLAVWWADTPRPGGRKSHRVDAARSMPSTAGCRPLPGMGPVAALPDPTDRVTGLLLFWALGPGFGVYVPGSRHPSVIRSSGRAYVRMRRQGRRTEWTHDHLGWAAIDAALAQGRWGGGA